MRIQYKLYIIFFTGVCFSSRLFAQSQQALPQLGKNTLKEVVAAMTLEEKARTVVGTADLRKIPPPPAPGAPVRPPLPPGFDFGTFFSRGKVKGSAGESYAITRLGIPSVIYADGPAGVRLDPFRNKDSTKSYYATAFPIATLLASSWDTALVKKVGLAMGAEVHDYGVDILLSPALNIQRNPLTGRNFEYYSEDPFLTGSMAIAMVNGLQQNNIGACIKHFAVNNQETYRNGINAIVSERSAREMYLKGFEMVVKQSKPWAVMSSYNKINGTYASENHDLLTKILRDDWHYKGFVMTDWWAEYDAVNEMKAGNDLLMPGTPDQVKEIVAAVKNGILDGRILDRNVENILTAVLKSQAFKKYQNNNAPQLTAHAKLARIAAAEGMILLKNNDKVLPLNSTAKKVALFGVSAYNTIIGGTGSGNVNRAYQVSIHDGLKNAGLYPDVQTANYYQQYIINQNLSLTAASRAKAPKFSEPELTPNMAVNLADEMDIALIIIGRNSGEGKDRKLENDFYLANEEKKLIKSISEAFHAKGKKVIAVLNIGGVIEIASWSDSFDAILLAWQPGQEAGNSIADCLTGKVNPSGKLAITFPVDYQDVPSAKIFPHAKDNMGEARYEEGIYVGYRYYNTFKVKPAYEFGYGLSYTTFKYSNITLDKPDFQKNITATVTVTNTGKSAGKEVVQLYLKAPADLLDKPESELKAFTKTKLLKPGEEQQITFTLHNMDLASFNTARSEWIADAGDYQIKIGSSGSVKQISSFKLNKKIVVEQVNKALSPIIGLSEIKP